MKVAVTLTIDGLIRTLRGIEHALVDAAEAGYAERPPDVRRAPERQHSGRERVTGGSDDSRGY